MGYLAELEQCMGRLAGNPALGRACDWICTGLHRFETGRHVVFYRQKPKGIFVVRILHRSMMPDRQTYEDDISES
jgi:toxin ParE1/3/4